MNPHIKRILLFIVGFVMALGGAISAMEGGASMTFSQLGQVPMVAWLFAIGAGINGVLGVTRKEPKS